MDPGSAQPAKAAGTLRCQSVASWYWCAAPSSRAAQHVGVQGVTHHGEAVGGQPGAGDAFGKSLGEGFAEPVRLDRDPVQHLMSE